MEPVEDKTARIRQLKAYRELTLHNMRTLLNKARSASANATIHGVLSAKLGDPGKLSQDFDDSIKESLMASNGENMEEVGKESDSFTELLLSVAEAIDQLRPALETTAMAPMTSPLNSTFLHGHSVRLPKLNVPQFSGKPLEWFPFFDAFMHAIGNNDALRPSQKLQYLKGLVKADAYNLIMSLPTVDSNYEVAIESLKTRYARRSVVGYHHLRELNNIPKVTALDYQTASRLHGIIIANVEALRAQEFPVDGWDQLIAFNILERLDEKTRRKFQESLQEDRMATVDELLNFLLTFMDVRTATTTLNPTSTAKSTAPTNTRRSNLATTATTAAPGRKAPAVASPEGCFVCKGNHAPHQCETFSKMSVQERCKLVTLQGRCNNCFSAKHLANSCPSPKKCFVCNRNHHSRLHGIDELVTAPPAAQPREATPHTTCCSAVSSVATRVILGTAIAAARDRSGRWIPVRCFLDSGSDSSYITVDVLERLQLKRSDERIPIDGFSGSAAKPGLGFTTIQIRPIHQVHPIYALDTVVVEHITKPMPAQRLPDDLVEAFAGLRLADSQFHVPGSVDVLIGMDLYCQLLTGGVTKRGTTHAFETTLGWVVGGAVQLPASHRRTAMCSTLDPLATALSRFWEVEEVHSLGNSTQTPSDDDVRVEEMFRREHRRTETGRYVVPLPFKLPATLLGNSFNIALRSYEMLRRRLQRNPTLKTAYDEFMRDYLQAGHMELDRTGIASCYDGYFLPHHGVLKETSSTTKLRVVFNGSMKTTSGHSLNDVLSPGPNLLCDLNSMLLNCRLHRYIFTTDIRQMYRGFLVRSEDQRYQKILWNFNSEPEPDIYVLKTVTYGINSSPFLAIRSLHQLADDEGAVFPKAARLLQNNVYVDDILAGGDTVEETVALRQELTDLLAKGQLELRKWSANHPDILNGVPEEHREKAFLLAADDSIKLLGVIWSPSADAFSFVATPTSRIQTKRSILSDIARIFDPLGWISPVTVTAKSLMQDLWLTKTGWDDPPPQSILARWNAVADQLPSLTRVSIQRHIAGRAALRLVGFADASERAFAAVVYAIPVGDGEVPQLLMAKSKVAPLKRQSLPRLELMAAVLLSRLLRQAKTQLECKVKSIHSFSDSMITLAWIRSPSHRWQTFVANRVSEIQDNIEPDCWSHVPSLQNPADIASRGALPEELISHPLWWHGPEWLLKPLEAWPISNEPYSSVDPPAALVEARKTTMVAQRDATQEQPFGSRSSSYDRLLFALCRWFRFVDAFKRRREKLPPIAMPEHFTVPELRRSLHACIRAVQREEFSDDIKLVQNNLPCQAKIQRLAPFIDGSGILRVGGRLKNANISYLAKHPALLPARHHFTDLVLQHVHRTNLHPGPRTMQALMSQRFWVLDARRVIRSNCRRCVKCFRCSPRNDPPLMADLTTARLEALKAFEHISVDYAGPFFITPTKGRGIKAQKHYLCVFVCLTTRAVHLEAASSLSTNHFIAAFRRFLARRGRCRSVVSDAGTNFVGARRLLGELHKFTCSAEFNNTVGNFLAAEQITWTINAPASPHFNGSAESCVKAVKKHLIRVIGEQRVTLEEFNTILCQIEAILNSRPLCDPSSDPNDLEALTPSHFLTLESAVALPDEIITLGQRWQLVQRIVNDLWRRWRQEYLQSLQVRQKWYKPSEPLAAGQLVIVREDNLPPSRWKLARILQTLPGSDGVIRVVKLRTSTGELTRPAVKVYPLPTSN